ncbi:branched-chain amino acid transport system permease protein [Conyzicola lurida]|uniref:Branched-chain amino acid transport system permease protein n=1 Tax=Conyzicola lurida TaxID=1172621 RepID=A0A841AS15_9MICO|nr:branched-chain amino acid transport system permease protein [Conyzicola lurida]
MSVTTPTRTSKQAPDADLATPFLTLAPRRPFPYEYVILTVILIAGAALPFILPAAEMAIAVRVLVFALMGIGWNIMSGFGGMFSFGHAAYFGIGSYTAGFMLVEFGVSPWIGLVVGMVVAVIAAVGISYLAFRYKLEGAYYAMSTFAFAEMLRLFVSGNDALHRTVGFTVPVLPESSFAMFQFDAGSPLYFWIGLVMVGIALLTSIVFLRSRTGRFTLAARDNEMAASALGINVLRYKLTAVAISAAITASAGVLYLQFYMFIDPDLAFGAHVSNNAIITTVVGGAGTIWGPLVGAIIMAPLSDVVAGFLRNPPEQLSFLAGHGGLDLLLYAVILIAFVILLPKGIYGTIWNKVKKK